MLPSSRLVETQCLRLHSRKKKAKQRGEKFISFRWEIKRKRWEIQKSKMYAVAESPVRALQVGSQQRLFIGILFHRVSNFFQKKMK